MNDAVLSYATLHKVVGFLGIGLVPVVVIGSLLLDHPPVIQVSVSAYYYTGMRDEMEGIICGIALFLMCYHGYSTLDSVISKLAGFFALGIAFLPTSDTSSKTDLLSILHYTTSGIFFALLAFMSIALFTKSAGHKTEQKIKRNRVYRVCGILMAVSVVLIPIDEIGVIHARIGFLKPTLILETIALVSFGISWLTKGEFILKDKPLAFPIND
ncbi:hypothetical protein [Dinghuibacter silviterrae]|uniref:DUF998 domain-containing protein n=1 Tax=Dinghuibacter silviterrae TaxID=1539049 RepID=A0A4R8DGT3_9BACT|nr:hypothetical protein [Dinghuibacter silviterrae]TDW96170.1 hypothetical protein EDB95_3993 [Dinghuibacter silviterrae]